MGTHYSPSQDPQALHAFAVKAATEIEVTLEGHMRVVLCYSGMSGIGMATALMMELTRRKLAVGMIYVRKEKEDSHGGPVECENVCTDKMNDAVLIFVDDFISMGGTFRRVQQGIYDNSNRIGSVISKKRIDYTMCGDCVLHKPPARYFKGVKHPKAPKLPKFIPPTTCTTKGVKPSAIRIRPKTGNRAPVANGKRLPKLDVKLPLHRCSARRAKSIKRRV